MFAQEEGDVFHQTWLLAFTVILSMGCSSDIELPESPLSISTDRYLKPSLKIGNTDVGGRVTSKKDELLTVSGEFSRLATELRDPRLRGVVIRFRCNNSSVNKSLERELKIYHLISDFKNYSEYATDLNGVITFQGKLRAPKVAGEYELDLSALESEKSPSGTEVRPKFIPLLRTVMRVD